MKIERNTLKNWKGRRIFSNRWDAEDAAVDLHSWLTVKEPVCVWKHTYGDNRNKHEYSVRLLSREFRDSKRIVSVVGNPSDIDFQSKKTSNYEN